MKFINLLPRFLRIKLIRTHIQVETPPTGFQVTIADKRADLENAYRLLHECYVHAKLMNPETSGLRCNYFTFLPQTTVVVAKLGNDVIGTVSLIKDSSMGLPSDKEFKTENDQLRKRGQKLLEVSSLAIDKKFRKKNHYISLYLMKYLQSYATINMGCDTVTCVVHPRASDFYTAFWGFARNKKIVKYKFVNNALGVHMFGNIKNENLIKLSDFFPNEKSRNPIQFLFTHDEFLKYPVTNTQNQLDPIYTPDLLRYFLTQRTLVHKTLSTVELRVIYSAYKTFFDQPDALNFLKDMFQDESKIRAFRFPTSIHAKLVGDQQTLAVGLITDLTADGAFFSTNHNLELGKSYRLEFRFADVDLFISMTPRWQNTARVHHLEIGYGIEFAQTQLQVLRGLKKTHLNERRVASRTIF